ncbi:MAG: hypothetical protein HYV20_03690 [Gemmatimonadetes bacterium]|nr:hypothetical protein [Gemmatimonadota bacterium]
MISSRTVLALVLLGMARHVNESLAQTHVLVVSGVGGDAQFTERFTRWGTDLVDAARQGLGLPPANVAFLAERPERDPRITGPATKERLEAALRELADRAEPGADVVLVLFGHGSDREGQPRFNLVGPDVTAAELATWLAAVKARRIVVVNTASASGGFVPALAGPGRIVVTATKSGFERNATRFGEYLVQALTAGVAGGAGSADTDKDGRLSVLEVFQYARREVARAYEQEKRLLTEHAILEDDGDGKGSTEPSATGGDGALAASVFLTAAGAVVAADTADPEVKRLYARRESLERRVAELRGARSSMALEVYERELEELLVELATTNRAIRAREGKRP